MGGLELASRVRQRWPRIHVLACSGYGPEPAGGELDDTVDALLAKPYNMSKLGRAVADVLAGK
jgi:CheY-like chemotaxis protein